MDTVSLTHVLMAMVDQKSPAGVLGIVSIRPDRMNSFIEQRMGGWSYVIEQLFPNLIDSAMMKGFLDINFNIDITFETWNQAYDSQFRNRNAIILVRYLQYLHTEWLWYRSSFMRRTLTTLQKFVPNYVFQKILGPDFVTLVFNQSHFNVAMLYFYKRDGFGLTNTDFDYYPDGYKPVFYLDPIDTTKQIPNELDLDLANYFQRFMITANRKVQEILMLEAPDIVASCVTCNEVGEKVLCEENNPVATFCGKSCQSRFYQMLEGV